MADITPVTREEFYLAKAGGQDVPVPSAVTREEHYLEKLSNDSVVVPTPVTRREKFLYFACGGEIDLPSEEKMTRLERLIAKAGGMDVSAPTAVTRLEKFWANVEGGWTVSTLTGTLPITFRSNGTALINYRMYGTSEGAGETKNLLEITAGSRTVNGVTFTVDKQAGTITANGTANSGAYFNLPINAPSGDYYYSGCALGGSASTYDVYAWDDTISGRPKKWDGETNVDSDYGGTSQEIKVDSEHSMQLTIRIRSRYTCNNLVFKPMLRRAETTPDFEPFGYKIPLVTVSGADSKTTVIPIGNTKLMAGDYIDYETGKVVRNGTPQDPPLPLPAIETFSGTNTLDSTETLGEVTIKGKIKEA